MDKFPWWSRLALLSVWLVSVAALAVLSSCNDDSADMARQISGGGGGAPRTPSKTPAGGDTAGGARGDKPGLPGKEGEAGADKGKPGMPGDEAAAGEKGKEEAEGVPQPDFELKVMEIKAPAPMFEDAGRYDIRIEVTLNENIEAKVWKIVAVDADGKEVGSDQALLTFPLGKPTPLAFNDMYCMKKPSDVKLIFTGKDAKKPSTGGTDKGSVSGGGISGGRSVGQGSGGGGASGGGASGGGDKGGEDKGGGGDDKGGEEEEGGA